MAAARTAALLSASVAALIPAAGALDNGLALTPQMGYNSWYDLTCSAAMNETTLRMTADKMVELNLPKLGYTYLNLDDCFVRDRLPNGTLVPDPTTFPSGMRALADYVHSKGMLFGVYTARCNQTCAQRPASLGHEAIDARTFALDWDADYLKEDSCRGCTTQDPMELYEIMSKALNATGKAVLFDMCWGTTQNMSQRVVTGNSWRIGPDDGNWVRNSKACRLFRAILYQLSTEHFTKTGSGQTYPEQFKTRHVSAGEHRAEHRHRLRFGGVRRSRALEQPVPPDLCRPRYARTRLLRHL